MNAARLSNRLSGAIAGDFAIEKIIVYRLLSLLISSPHAAVALPHSARNYRHPH